MTESPDATPADVTLGLLHQNLADAALAVGLTASDARELTSNIFRGGERAQSARLEAGDLPSVARGLRLGRYAVLLGVLPDQPSLEAVSECLRRFRNQCVVARSYLSPNEALDLQGVLVGPRGSEPLDAWRPLALLVERDDRVARKFAWLRPTDDAADPASFAELLKRTFLARPWKGEATFTMAELDNLNRAAARSNASVPRDTVDKWVKLALTARADPDALVDGLVDAWKQRGQA